MTIFKTKNFSVRLFKDEDSINSENFLADVEVMKYIGDGNFQLEKTTSLAMIHWFQKTCENSRGLGTWAIVSNESNNVVGSCHLSECLPLKVIEFGLALERKYWRKGYATEICESLLFYGQNQLGIENIVGVVHPGNVSSKRLLKKLGYYFEREIEYYGILQELYLRL